MGLFVDLSSLSEWAEWDSDSDSRPDKVAPPDSDVSVPPSPQLAPLARPSSLDCPNLSTK